METYQPALVDLHDGINEDANVEGLQVRGNIQVGYEQSEGLHNPSLKSRITFLIKCSLLSEHVSAHKIIPQAFTDSTFFA